MIKKDAKKTNKGFTLVEVLGTIVILGVILGISVPLISRAVKKSQLEQMEIQESNLALVGKNYFLDNRSELPTINGDTATVLVSDLVLAGYINEVKDYNNNVCDLVNSYVEVTRIDKGDYDYSTYLYCDSYETGDAWTEWAISTEVPDLPLYPPVEVVAKTVYNYYITTGTTYLGDPVGDGTTPYDPDPDNYVDESEVRYNYQTYDYYWTDYSAYTSWSTSSTITALPSDTETEKYKYEIQYNPLIGYKYYRWARYCQCDVTIAYEFYDDVSSPGCVSPWVYGGYTWYNYAIISNYGTYYTICGYGRTYYVTTYNQTCESYNSNCWQSSSWKDYASGYYFSAPSGYPNRDSTLPGYGSTTTGETLPSDAQLVQWRQLISTYESTPSANQLTEYLAQSDFETEMGDTLANLEANPDYIIQSDTYYWRIPIINTTVDTVQFADDTYYEVDDFVDAFNSTTEYTITSPEEVDGIENYTLIVTTVYEYRQRKY